MKGEKHYRGVESKSLVKIFCMFSVLKLLVLWNKDLSAPSCHDRRSTFNILFFLSLVFFLSSTPNSDKQKENDVCPFWVGTFNSWSLFTHVPWP